MLNLLAWLAVGALIGWLASRIMKTKGGLVRNIIIGIVGSVLGGWLADVIGLGGGNIFSLTGLLISLGGACLLIAAGRFVFRN